MRTFAHPQASRRMPFKGVPIRESAIQAIPADRIGVSRNGKPSYDLIGLRFGRLVAQSRGEAGHGGRVRWSCVCDCGGTALAFCGDLRSGHTGSCGCLKNEEIAARSTARATHGHARANKRTTEYLSWAAMRQRCYKPATRGYEYYGGRGITVCDRWSDFVAFLSDMGPKPSPKHSIDRINVDGNYEPGNCRWATGAEQQANKRPSGGVQ